MTSEYKWSFDVKNINGCRYLLYTDNKLYELM